MGYIDAIQVELADHNKPIAGALLKIRLLAAKLGSDELAEWIKNEAQGYDTDADIPSYRIVPMSVYGTFSGPFGSGIKNAPIPSLLVKEIVGADWTTYKIRQSAAAVEELTTHKNGLQLDMSNLMLVLRGKIYPDFEPVQLVGSVSRTAIIDVANAIRNRLLEITVEVSNKVPNVDGVAIASIEKNPEVARQIFHQTVHGNVTNIQSTGGEATIQVTVRPSDRESLEKFLVSHGLSKGQTDELAELIVARKPNMKEDAGLNPGVRKWLADRITASLDVGLKGGVTALTQIVKDAVTGYWGPTC